MYSNTLCLLVEMDVETLVSEQCHVENYFSFFLLVGSA